MSEAYYVDPCGSDSNPGSESEPFQSIFKAQAAVRQDPNRGKIPITVRRCSIYDVGRVGKEDGGLQVLAVPGESPATGEVLRAGDLIQSVNGTPVPNAGAFQDAVKDLPDDAPVRLGLVRYQNMITLELR